MKENTGAVHVQIPVDVATFLLNEKRDDIRTIELRHKVNIVLIPNIHLETPAHEIVRLRHDQLNQEDQALPSYKMVEAPPTEAYQPPSAQTDARPSRPEAAVKGITPSQPAPVIEPKPVAQPAQAAQASAADQPGIIDKIFGWFRGNRKAEPTPVAKAEPPARRDQPREGRSERGRGRDRGERGRQEPRDRQEPRQRSQQTPRPEQEPRGERRPRQDRAERQGQEPRQPRQPRQQEQRQPQPQAIESPIVPLAGALESALPGAVAEQQEERRGRRGRRGRGRDRGERRPEGQTAETVEGGAAQTAMATEVMSQAIEQVPPIFEPAAAPIQEAAPAPVPLPAAETAIVDEMTRAPAEVALAPVPVPAPEPEAPMPDGVVAAPAPAPTPAPVESAEAAETLAMPAPVKPLVDISVALQDSGLVMVETSREKANVAPQAEPEMRLGRKPRTAAVISNEPMMQVETRK